MGNIFKLLSNSYKVEEGHGLSLNTLSLCQQTSSSCFFYYFSNNIVLEQFTLAIVQDTDKVGIGIRFKLLGANCR